MNTESITLEIQQMKSTKGIRSGESNGAPPSIADTTLTEEEGRSMASFQSDSGVHASQVVAAPSTTSAPSTSEGAQQQQQPETAPKKSKRQLWDDLTISGRTTA